MRPDNIPEKKTSPGLATGIIFIAVGLSMLGENNSAGGAVFLILGLIFLVGHAAARGGGAKKKARGDMPPEPELRERQAAAERRLRGEALAPDGRKPAPIRSAPARPAAEPAVRTRADGLEQRREELRGLLDSGIIDRDEYRDRMRDLRP